MLDQLKITEIFPPFLKSALLGVAFVVIPHTELGSERVVWLQSQGLESPACQNPNCPCNSIPVPLCLGRVGQGEGSERLNGKLIIIIVTGPVQNTHIPSYSEGLRSS